MDFTSAVVAGIPLVLVVIGLVAYAKKLGLAGNALTAVSLFIGLVLGIGYQISLKSPVDFGGWFAVAIYGLGLGLVASGIYDTAKGLATLTILPVAPAHNPNIGEVPSSPLATASGEPVGPAATPSPDYQFLVDGNVGTGTPSSQDKPG